MREKINRLARGIVDTESPECVLKPAVIEETVRAGEAARGEFFVLSGNGLTVKGLVYSTDGRVKIPDNSFGGLRSRISYEVDSELMADGEEIRGSFCLVTNAGEVTLPYVFRAEAGVSARMLSELRKPVDFARLARENRDLACRLFEYRDFPSAPFMQGIRARAVYEGLKGGRDRAGAVEEFMVAMDMKPPVEVYVKEETRKYGEHIAAFDDSLVIRKKNWGYVKLEVETEGEFLTASRERLTDRDFKNGEYVLTYRVDPDRMHRGRNLGCITIKGIRSEAKVFIAADGHGQEELQGMERIARRKEFQKYLALRLDCESGKGSEKELWQSMAGELLKLRDTAEEDLFLDLLTAEAAVMTGKADRAEALLEEIRDRVWEKRHQSPELYCFYQYLVMETEKKPGQLEALLRLLHSFTDGSRRHFFLFYLLLKLDDSLYDNPGVLLEQMRDYFRGGCCSPFLYIQACRLLNKDPVLLRDVDAFVIHALRLGVKRKMVGRELAEQTARLAAGAGRYERLYFKLLTELFEEYGSQELLAAICSMLIRGEKTSAKAFAWYEKGLEAGLDLTRLYEYYLASLPDGYDHLMPKEVLLYFSYARDLDETSKSRLYRNILLYLKQDDPIYRLYERDMEQFAVEQVFQSRINSRLAVLYEHMLYRDMIDIPLARLLPAVLKAYRIECRNPNMRYVVVCHEELDTEDAYQLQNGVAYVPLFSERNVLVFQDGCGGRYMNVSFVKTRVMNRPDLESRCFEVYPEHPMLLLMNVRRILDGSIGGEEDVAVLEHALEQEHLSPLYGRLILDRIIAYYDRLDGEPDGMEKGIGYLLRMDKAKMTGKERKRTASVFIKRGYFGEAWDILSRYGWQNMDMALLGTLCSRVILKNLFDEDERLLRLAADVFQAGRADAVVLDYLCEHYNGTTDMMYRILEAGTAAQAETYDLEERLLAQMLFGSSMEHIDRVFELYTSRKRVSDSLVRAFFILRSMEYFLGRAPMSDLVSDHLEHMVKESLEKDKVPVVYLLALTKYYSGCPSLTAEQKDLCRTLTDLLLKAGMVFPYMQKLAAHIPMPEEITSKVMIQYNGRKDSRAVMLGRILPEETEFRQEEMKRVYQGIFVKQTVLFDGEVLEYEIYDDNGKGRELRQKGKIDAAPGSGRSDSRFSSLNHMGTLLKDRDLDGLKQEMRDYLTKTGTAEQLFDLM